MSAQKDLSEWLEDAEEDAKFARRLVDSPDPKDQAMLAEKVRDIAHALVNAANGIKRRVANR